MTPQQRLDVIRRRARHALLEPLKKAKGVHLATVPDAVPAHRMKRAKELVRSRQKWRSSVYGLDLRMSQTGAEWTKLADEKPAEHCTHKRRRGKHPLTRIAELLPRKLPTVVRAS